MAQLSHMAGHMADHMAGHRAQLSPHMAHLSPMEIWSKNQKYGLKIWIENTYENMTEKYGSKYGLTA